MTDALEPSDAAIMTQTDELTEKVYNIVDAVAGGAEVTYANGHPRNPKLSAGATDAIINLMEQVRADERERLAVLAESAGLRYERPLHELTGDAYEAWDGPNDLADWLRKQGDKP